MSAFNEGRYETAIEHLTAALEEASRSGNINDLGLSTYFLEASKAFQEDREMDKEKIETSLRFFRQSGEHYLAAGCCESLSATADLETARQLLGEAREHYKQCPNWTGEARTYRIEAEIAKRFGNVDRARELLQKALRAIRGQPQGLETVKAELRKIERQTSAL